MHNEQTGRSAESESKPAPKEISWPLVLLHIHLHLGSVYALYLIITEAYVITSIFALILGAFAVLGVTAGAHRLWAHQSYTASPALRAFLVFCQTLTGECSLYDWVRDHRLHHKNHGSEADIYNSKKGFFYSHFVSHVMKTNEDYEKQASVIDMSDVEKDSIVMFQKRFYWILMPIFCLLLPVNAPVEYWGETILNSCMIVGILRYTTVLHFSWLVNTAVQVWGIGQGEENPASSNLIFFLTKSYWPQYHYLLPWDYQSGEYGTYGSGCTTALIRVWAALGWATGLRTMDSNSVRKALENAVETKRSLIECLNEAERNLRIMNESPEYLSSPVRM